MKVWKWIFLTLFILLFIFLFFNIGTIHGALAPSQEKLKRWGPLGFILLQFLQVLFAPIPGHALGVAGGALFGTFWGGVYTLIAQTGGGLLLFFLTRRYGLRSLKKYMKEAILQKIVSRIQKTKIGHWGWGKSNHSTNIKFVIALFLMYLLPGFPDDLLALLAGLTQITFLSFLMALLLGRIPGIFLLAYIGEGTLHLPQFLRWFTL